MEHQIHYSPAYAMAEIILKPGDSLVVESGSMVGMSPNLEIKTSIGGTGKGFLGRLLAFFGALLRKFLGGESIFLNTYQTISEQGCIFIAPPLPGDIITKQLDNQEIFIQRSSFLACSPGITLKTKWGGLRTFFGGEGLFLLQAFGKGEIWLNSYGAIQEIEIKKKYIVDSGHIVAFDSGVNFRVKTIGGLKSTLLSGEGLVTEFSGNGKLYIQTHNLNSIVNWVTPLLPR